jgi:hypothetical protein
MMDTASDGTAILLPFPDVKAVYRVYIVCITGNERASNAAAVTRV